MFLCAALLRWKTWFRLKVFLAIYKVSTACKAQCVIYICTPVHFMPPTSSWISLSFSRSVAASYEVCGCYLVPFVVLKLLPVRFLQPNLWCCISKSTMKHQQKSYLPWLIQLWLLKVLFLRDWFLKLNIAHAGPPSRVHHWVWCSW